MPEFKHSSDSRFRRVTTTTTLEEEFNEPHHIPMATETHVNNPEEIPFAKQIFDTKKLYRRWATCCEMSLNIAHVGLQHADNLQTQATIGATFGALFGSQSMQEDASETNKRAHEARKSALVVSVGFLLIAVLLTTLYWVVEEGLIGTIVKSIAACGSSCVNALRGVGSWIAEKTTGMFKSNKVVEQRNNLQKKSDLEEESDLEEDVPTAVPVLAHNTTENNGNADADQDMSEFKRNMFMPSGGHTSPRPSPVQHALKKESPSKGKISCSIQ